MVLGLGLSGIMASMLANPVVVNAIVELLVAMAVENIGRCKLQGYLVRVLAFILLTKESLSNHMSRM